MSADTRVSTCTCAAVRANHANAGAEYLQAPYMRHVLVARRLARKRALTLAQAELETQACEADSDTWGR
eukprot:14074389-Alexandrium_andersonii.AAC.1